MLLSFQKNRGGEALVMPRSSSSSHEATTPILDYRGNCKLITHIRVSINNNNPYSTLKNGISMLIKETFLSNNVSVFSFTTKLHH